MYPRRHSTHTLGTAGAASLQRASTATRVHFAQEVAHRNRNLSLTEKTLPLPLLLPSSKGRLRAKAGVGVRGRAVVDRDPPRTPPEIL